MLVLSKLVFVSTWYHMVLFFFSGNFKKHGSVTDLIRSGII